MLTDCRPGDAGVSSARRTSADQVDPAQLSAIQLNSWSPETAETGLLVATTKSISILLTVFIAALILAPWLTVRKVQVQARVQSPAVIEITFPDSVGVSDQLLNTMNNIGNRDE